MTTRALTRSEIKGILHGAYDLDDKQRDHALLVIGFSCGYRISEILSLLISDVAVIRNGRVVIRDCVRIDKTHMKGGKKDRAIRLNSDAKNVLQSYVEGLLAKEMSISNPLFGGRKGQGKTHITRQSAWRIIKQLADRFLGDSEHIGTHSLRKSFATHLYLATHDIYRVSAVLGHSFVSTTERYIKDAIAMMDDNLEQLSLI